MGLSSFPGGRMVLFTVASINFPTVDHRTHGLGPGRHRHPIARFGGAKDPSPRRHRCEISANRTSGVRAKGTLLAVPFDPAKGVTTGSPTPLVEGVRERRYRQGESTSEVSGKPRSGGRHRSGGSSLSRLTDCSRISSGRLQRRREHSSGWTARAMRCHSRAPDRAYAYPRISPDGRRLAVDIRDQDQDIWVWDFDRETLTKLTFDPAADVAPLWTLDGQRIIFFTNGQGLRSQASDGTGSVESAD